MSKTVLFQTIQFSTQKQFSFKQFNLAYVRSLNIKIVLFQAIQFSISIQFSSILPIYRTLSGAITLGQSRPGSDGNEGVLRIPQGSSITGTSPSDCLVSYLGHSLGVGPYPSREKQSGNLSFVWFLGTLHFVKLATVLNMSIILWFSLLRYIIYSLTMLTLTFAF